MVKGIQPKSLYAWVMDLQIYDRDHEVTWRSFGTWISGLENEIKDRFLVSGLNETHHPHNNQRVVQYYSLFFSVLVIIEFKSISTIIGLANGAIAPSATA
jgi:hypothetical protein